MKEKVYKMDNDDADSWKKIWVQMSKNNYKSSLMFRPYGSKVFARRMRCASRALRTASLLLNIFSIGISCISLEGG